MNRPQVFVNGKRVGSEGTTSFPFQEDKIFVFETFKSYRGAIFRLTEHLNRLFESAKTVGLELPKSIPELKKELTRCLKSYRNGDLTLRLAVDEQDSYLWILERKRPARIYEEGVCLRTSAVRRNIVNAEPPQAKSSAFFNNVLAALGEDDDEIFDTVFLDSNGYVAEATIWNVFIVKGNQLWTPRSGILNGVTREFVIKCAGKEGFPVVESNLTRHDIWNADEAFLTNTSGEIVPICSLDGRSVGKRVPGTMTQKLTARFRRDLEKELKRT